MHTARIIAALAVGAVAGEFFASPLARLLDPLFADQSGLAAAIALPLAVAGVGAIIAGLLSLPTKAARSEPRACATGEGEIFIGPSTVFMSVLRDPATGRFKAKA